MPSERVTPEELRKFADETQWGECSGLLPTQLEWLAAEIERLQKVAERAVPERKRLSRSLSAKAAAERRKALQESHSIERGHVSRSYRHMAARKAYLDAAQMVRAIVTEGPTR